jgi:aminoglycoside 6-adenylyltransferase
MIVWENAERTRYAVAPGYEEKHLKRLMEPPEWRELLGTYSDAGPEAMWDALFAAGRLFRKAAHRVAAHNGFEYPANDDEAVSAFIEKIRALPADALDL